MIQTIRKVYVSIDSPLKMSEDCTSLYCSYWEPPESQAPTSPVVINVSVVASRAVLKKASAIRIPTSIGHSQSIVADIESLSEYSKFSTFMKASCRALNPKQNTVFFRDFDDEHKFIHNIQCLWAICALSNEVTILAVTLHNDLTCRLVKWDKVSPDVVNDLTPPPSPDAKKQTISSMQAINSAERRQRAVEILNEESSMEFSGPIFKRNQDDPVCSITVWKRYVPLLLSLNSLIFTIDHQFLQIGRTIPIDEKLVTQLCSKILEEHIVDPLE